MNQEALPYDAREVVNSSSRGREPTDSDYVSASFGAIEIELAGRLTVVGRLVLCLAVVCLLLSGCEKQLPTEYGRRSGPSGTQSVNGLGVLASMFEQAGHDCLDGPLAVSLGRREGRCDRLAPDDTAPPSQAVREWFEHWMDNGKTLIYIGRDYDAEATYWQKILPDAPEEERAEIERRLKNARLGQSFRRRAASDKTDCEWFHNPDRSAAPRPANSGRGRILAGRRRPVENGNRTGRPDDTGGRRRGFARFGRRRAGHPPGHRFRPVDRRVQRVVPVEPAAGESRASEAGRQADRSRRTEQSGGVFGKRARPVPPPSTTKIPRPKRAVAWTSWASSH